MKLKEAMTKNVHTIATTANLEQAARMMDQHNVGLLPVVDRGQAVGVITDRDLAIRAIAHGLDPKSTPVLKAMTKDLVTVNEDQELDEAIELMKNNQLGRLIVKDKTGRIVGVFSASDAAYIYKGDQRVGELAAEISKRTHTKQATVR